MLVPDASQLQGRRVHGASPSGEHLFDDEAFHQLHLRPWVRCTRNRPLQTVSGVVGAVLWDREQAAASDSALYYNADPYHSTVPSSDGGDQGGRLRDRHAIVASHTDSAFL